MNLLHGLPKNTGLMVLSISLAIVLWLFVNYDKDSETEMNIQVIYKDKSPDLTIINKPPELLNVRISGPRLRLMRLRPDTLVVSLDLRNIREGSVAFTDLDKAVPLHRDLRVTRVYPATIEVQLARTIESGR